MTTAGPGRVPDPTLPGSASDTAALLATDRDHVWHPYAPMPATRAPIVVESAQGVRLTLPDGRELVDGMSSWWSAIHGYRHPRLDAAVRDQLGRMSHVMFGGLTHGPAVDLARLLVDVGPEGLEHVFLADSGSVSVEVAIKMCLQYWRSRGRPGKHRLMTWRRGYHGDTFGAMSVCDPDGGMHSLWSDVLPQQVFADAPPEDFSHDYVAHLAELVETHADELAAVVVEPVVQGAGGCASTTPATCTCCASCATPTTCCSCSTRSPPASAAPVSCSPPTTRPSPRTSCASARRSPAAT
ncbi:Adenosylmethionine-8-amino-7-oxononanoate aminotransferase [Pseudonocardia sp. Ae406_Ps2]|nr:Adenosylmethionine-8-amino-7-oxononanoate aminotransferase [Pseudonocardia sp. Ae406_Ps2]OLM08078.1 Adenosylmethionine-8-amino-7-oxononanoate aminotransferase [Pseudonocardia sp. Ae331_Ps2]OLM21697.1 Adenosylmethionine-8-amino-7-oxononanoate aminotransferase [Pseudonocardia sp. Ae706_Ps2]